MEGKQRVGVLPGSENQMREALLFHIDKTSLGVSHIGVATPWDDCPYTKSNANTPSVLILIGFSRPHV